MVRKTNTRRRKNQSGKTKKKRGGYIYKKSPMLGGSAYLEVLSKDYYYPYNSNPNYLNTQLKGGSKRKRSGGGITSLGPVLDPNNLNVLLDTNIGNDITRQPASNVFPHLVPTI
jgi:hypothetical protein